MLKKMGGFSLWILLVFFFHKVSTSDFVINTKCFEEFYCAFLVKANTCTQTCHSPGETNLNEYEKKSECGEKNLNDIAPPPPTLSYRRLMKSIHHEGRKKSPPS